MRSGWFGAGAVAVVASSVLVGGHGPVGAVGGGTEITERFGYTGGVQTFVVPQGVSQVESLACGGQGGEARLNPDATGSDTGAAGLGGQATGVLQVTPGEALVVVVGGSGAPIVGGFNGGGDVEPSNSGVGGGGGGGASDVRQGGSSLTDRVVVGAGGGGGGFRDGFDVGGGFDGGDGGGLVGAPGSPTSGGGGGTQTTGGRGGIDSFFGTQIGQPGTLGSGGSSRGSGGGGGGLYGGGGGGLDLWEDITDTQQVWTQGGGGGGSSFGDSTEPGVCEGDGWVEITYVDARPGVIPFRVVVKAEGDAGSTRWQLPVSLSEPLTEPVTVDYRTVDGIMLPGLASSGADFVPTSGTLTFAPGETVAYVDIEILADTTLEPPLLWGEWGIVQFSNPSPNVALDTSTFFGAGLFVILDDD